MPHNQTPPPPNKPFHSRQQTASLSHIILPIGVATVCRIVINTSRRFVYPFAPALSRGLGVPLTAITSIIAVNQATGILALFFGPLIDRWGSRLMMLIGLGILSLGMFAGGFLPYYSLVLIGLLLAGLGKNIFDPAIQSYVGQNVPYNRRGLVIGLLEFSWAASTLLGMPLIGFLIDRHGWRSPFLALGGAGLIGLAALAVLLPPDSPRRTGTVATVGFLKTWGILTKQRAAVGALIFGFFTSAGNDNLFVVYGAWLETSFQLSLLALGLGTSVIGAAELIGETLTAAWADRIGLTRAVKIGVISSVLAYLILPFTGHSLVTALAGLFITFVAYELTVVSTLSLCTELVPGARGTMMSAFLATAGLGRVIGALIGGPVWLAGGISAVAIVAAGLTLVGIAGLMWGLKNWQPQNK
jgi:MFS transporter, DHA1 family, inner membrane transport protein